jgi:hypothetical protein
MRTVGLVVLMVSDSGNHLLLVAAAVFLAGAAFLGVAGLAAAFLGAA